MNIKTLLILLIGSIGVQTTFAQQKGTFTDPRDGKKYKTVKIGAQTWMAENLDYAGKNNEIGACYEKKSENCKKYGALYNWYDAKKICPPSWHLPTNYEWQILIDFTGGNEVAGATLKAKSGWSKGTVCGHKEVSDRGIAKQYACDHFGFSALPGGVSEDGFFKGVGYGSGWWSASEDNADNASGRTIVSDYADIENNSGNKSGLLSVRCVKD